MFVDMHNLHVYNCIYIYSFVKLHIHHIQSYRQSYAYIVYVCNDNVNVNVMKCNDIVCVCMYGTPRTRHFIWSALRGIIVDRSRGIYMVQWHGGSSLRLYMVLCVYRICFRRLIWT